jgi:hypothetical protein
VRNGFARERRESACGVREEGEHRIGYLGKISVNDAGCVSKNIVTRQNYFSAKWWGAILF